MMGKSADPTTLPILMGVLALAAITGDAARSAEPGLTCSIAGDTLGEALPEIGRLAKRPVAAGARVKDRRYFLYLRGRTLPEFQDALKQFVPQPPGTAAWYLSGGVLRFEEDIRSEQARLERARARWRRETALRQAGLRKMQEWVKPIAGEWQGKINGRNRHARWMRLFDSLPPAAKMSALGGKSTRVFFDELSPGGLDLVNQMVVGRQPGDAWRRYVEITPDRLSPEHLTLELHIRSQQSGGPVSGDLVNEPTWVRSEGWVDAHPDQYPGIAAYRDRRRGPARAAQMPALARLIPVPGGADTSKNTVDRILSQLCTSSGLSLVGEYDPCWGGTATDPRFRNRAVLGPPKPGERKPVWEVLELVARAFDLEWDYQQGWLQLRSPRTVDGWLGDLDLSPPPARSGEETVSHRR